MRVARRSWQEYYKGQSTTEWKLRGAALDDAIKKASPTAAMELGTYCGYSAIRIGRLLPPGGKLVSVEVDPLYAAIATKVLRRPSLCGTPRHSALTGAGPPHCRQVVEHAGLGDSVKIEIGDLAEKFDRIATKYSLGPCACERVPSWRCLSSLPWRRSWFFRGGWLRRPLAVRASELLRARRRAGCHCGREARPRSPIPRRSTPATPA